MEKQTMLQHWGSRVVRAANTGVITGKPVQVNSLVGSCGPRAGVVEVDAGIDNGSLLRGLMSNQLALARHLIPFEFVGDPIVSMRGRSVRIEAGWPSEWADKWIPFRDVLPKSIKPDRWVVGKTERGDVITTSFSDKTPHVGIFGTTGGGKTMALETLVAQMSTKETRLVLVDGKYGDNLKKVSHVSNMVAPVATDVQTARAALSWAVGQMHDRLQGGQDKRRMIVVVDEAKPFISDPIICQCVQAIVEQGRSVNVHLVISTQHPVVGSVGGPTVMRNIDLRIVFMVTDSSSSSVAVGGETPRADWLLGQGDGYVVLPGRTFHRFQGAVLDYEPEVVQPEMDAWDTEEFIDLPERWPEPDHVAAALVSDGGRVKYQKLCENWGVKPPSNDRAVELLKWARGILDVFKSRNISVVG